MVGDRARPAPAARIESLDLLRGWAVFGMLIVNVGYFGRNPAARPEGLDAVAAVLVQVLAAGKFWTLFSMLFGYGCALQMERAAWRGERFVPPYLRRLAVLFGIGLLHISLHPSEILHRYALLGVLLIPLRESSVRMLTVAGVLSVLVGALIPMTTASVNPTVAASIYASGSLGDVVRLNLQRFVAAGLDIRLIEPFPFFLIGLALGRRRVLQDPDLAGEILDRVRWWVLGAGVIMQTTPLVVVAVSSGGRPSIVQGLAVMMMAIGNGLVGLFYAALVLRVARHDAMRPVVRTLTAVGRLALTNYLCQTLIVTSLLYGYGGGWYGRLGDAAGVPLAIVVFLIQAGASSWWIRRFRVGPVEWCWRSVAQGRWQPI